MSTNIANYMFYYIGCGENVFYCILCNASIDGDDDQIEFERHLLEKHPGTVKIPIATKAEDTTDARNTDSTELDINSNVVVVSSMPIMEELQIQKHLLGMISQDLQPLSIVEDAGFMEFVKIMKPDFRLPSTHSLGNSMLKVSYHEARHTISDKLENIDNICLSIETWTSIDHDVYVSLMSHFVDSMWDFESAFLGCFKVSDRLSSENIRDEILSKLVDWKLHDKVVCVVCDNVDVIVDAVKLTGLPHVACFAKTLDAVIAESFRDPKLYEIVTKCKSMIDYFNRSLETDNETEIGEGARRMNNKLLKTINIPTSLNNWNGYETLQMCEQLLKNQNWVESACKSREGSSANMLTSHEWKTLKKLFMILQPFVETMSELKKENFMPLSKVLVMIQGLQSCLTKWEAKECNELCSYILHELIAKIKSRFRSCELNEVYAMASFLDPRFKSFAFCDSSAFQYCREETELLLDISSELLQKSDSSPKKAFDNTFIWQEFDMTMNSSKSLVEKYMNEDMLCRKECPFLWWKERAEIYPGLASLAKKYLTLVATSIPSNMICSTAGKVLYDRRNLLESDYTEQILFLHYNQKFYN